MSEAAFAFIIGSGKIPEDRLEEFWKRAEVLLDRMIYLREFYSLEIWDELREVYEAVLFGAHVKSMD